METEFFSRPAYLTVSAQLHLEAVSSGLSRVYTLSPTFRAERSQTHRHLSEFWMLEAEMAFCTRLQDVMGVLEDSIKSTLTAIRDNSNLDLEVLHRVAGENNRTHLALDAISCDWARMTYTEAVEKLQAHQATTKEFEFPVEWGLPLQSEHEKWLAGKLIGGPVFVTDYPAKCKPFYMRLNDLAEGVEDRQTVACFDLLLPGVGELVGGSLREERLSLLESAVIAHKMPLDDFQWYLDLRRFGTVPHGGYGLGFERFVSWVTGVENIRECIAFPRWGGNMTL
jgi:asparaginyl-tRNA synthetase